MKFRRCEMLGVQKCRPAYRNAFVRVWRTFCESERARRGSGAQPLATWHSQNPKIGEAGPQNGPRLNLDGEVPGVPLRHEFDHRGPKRCSNALAVVRVR